MGSKSSVWMILLIIVQVVSCTVRLQLNGIWTLTSPAIPKSIVARVPGTVHTSLMGNDIIGDPYFMLNDDKYAWIADQQWTYERNFDGEYFKDKGTPSDTKY